MAGKWGPDWQPGTPAQTPVVSEAHLGTLLACSDCTLNLPESIRISCLLAQLWRLRRDPFLPSQPQVSRAGRLRQSSRFSRVLAVDASSTVHQTTAGSFIGNGRWI